MHAWKKGSRTSTNGNDGVTVIRLPFLYKQLEIYLKDMK